MPLRPLLAAVVLLAVAPAPILAQEPAPPAAAPAPAPEPMTPEQAAFTARGEAFQTRLEAMNGELEQAMADPATDAAGKTAATNAILARYQPDVDAFAGELEAFLRAQAELPENAAKRADMLAAAATAPAAVRGIPDMVRQAIAEALAAPAAAPQ